MNQGTPESVWRSATLNPNIEGFATQISVNHGQTVNFKINTNSRNYRIDIYRLGYYGGDGARLLTTIQRQLGAAQVQPAPIVNQALGLVDAGNWGVSSSWAVPTDAVSGIYLAKLVRQDGTAGVNEIPFIVRNDEGNSDIVFQTSDTTWQAYNPWGGSNFYQTNVGAPGGRAYKVSYNRPISTQNGGLAAGPQDYIFGAEYPAIRWLEQNGYDVSYIAGVDTARAGAALQNHKVFLSVGHDEYWSGEQRANVEAARDAGVNLAFWSGNEVYWKTRWENSIDGSGTPFRTLVCYKETWADTGIDPSSTSTGTWRDARFLDPGQKPENALTGTMFQVDSYRADTISVPYDMSQFRFWRNTSISDLQQGQTGALVTGLLGYEWDSDVDNGFRPAGLVDLSLSTVAVNTYLFDYGSRVGDNTATHSLTMYRADSGALVFSAGTVYWSWGLDPNHDNEQVATDPKVRQAMVNLFADMGIQPGTLDASLVLANGSADSTAPTSTVSTVSSGGTFVEGEAITVTGTAQDSGGGKVAGIEVSLDSGATWRKATGFNNWSYSGRVEIAGNYTVLARAVDDSLNRQATPTTGTPITVALPPGSTLWTFADKPADTDSEFVQDSASIEVGTKFQTTAAGTVTAIRFYKSFLNQGTHTAHLWTASGTLLASTTFTNETPSGWQIATFSQPVTVNAGTTYVASYHTGDRYSASAGYFNVGRTRGQLVASVGAGVSSYGDTATFPTDNSGNRNYWVDVQFETPAGNRPPVAMDDSGFTTQRDAAVTLAAVSLLANDSDPDQDGLNVTAVGGATQGTVALNTQAQTITFTPSAGYTGPASFTYTIGDGRGGTATANVALTVTPPSTALSLFSPSATPATITENDPNPVELGMKFRASSTGTISGIKFYKGPQNTGAHQAHLWSSTGALLATATFTNETASGWQTATFASPVSISANTTYIASYHSNGFYSDNVNYFAGAVTNGSLTGLASGSSGGNGVYAYGGSGVFPNATYSNTNYWVDVLYNQGTATNQNPVAANDSGFSTQQGTALTIAAAALLGNDSDPDGDPLSITSVGNASNGMVALNAQAQTITFTPAAGYNGPGGFTYTIGDGRGGSASANVALTVNPPGTALSLFAPTDGPAGPAEDNPNAVELGMKFRASSAGTISGIKFYKGSQDTGVHQAHLWSSTGTLLATATFSNETASGWQTATFSSPASIAANTTYVASYHSNGRYTATGNYFANAVTNGPLTGLASGASGGNGVYVYGASGLFPNATYGAANYWVDVVYNQGSGANNNPVAANDSGFTTQQDAALTIAAAALLGNDSDPDGDPLNITGVGGASNGTIALNAQAQTVTFTPAAGYTGAAGFTYTIGDGRGGSASANVALTVNQAGTALSLFAPSAAPTTVTENDSSPVELGMKFRASSAGTISGIKFYKGPQNTGVHEAHLWSSTGTLLATATFSNETATGWQTATFSAPVTIAANTTYVASYHSNGFYSADNNYFANAVTNGLLTGLASGSSGGNGVYTYGTSGLFPASTFGSTNYWVDVVYNQGSGANNNPVAVNDSGFATQQDTALALPASALLANDSDLDGDPLSITSVGGASNGTVALNQQAQTVTFTPNAGYTGAAQFAYTIGDGRGGTATANVALTVNAAGGMVSLFSPSDIPATITDSDPNPVELGMKFTSDVAGSITAIKFYKGPQNTGVHEGHLWRADGTLLATTTFTNETASGWQTAALATPVAITAGTAYLASYHSNGRYSATGNYFDTEHANGPLRAPASTAGNGNGVYAYGGSGLFPSGSYNKSNYWVDVVFSGQLAA